MITSDISINQPPREQQKIEPLPSSMLGSLRDLKYDKALGKWTRPVFCASCGKSRGRVNWDMTFAFIMCDPCWESFGYKTEFMGIPDAIARQERVQDQLAEAKPGGL